MQEHWHRLHAGFDFEFAERAETFLPVISLMDGSSQNLLSTTAGTNAPERRLILLPPERWEAFLALDAAERVAFRTQLSWNPFDQPPLWAAGVPEEWVVHGTGERKIVFIDRMAGSEGLWNFNPAATLPSGASGERVEVLFTSLSKSQNDLEREGVCSYAGKFAVMGQPAPQYGNIPNHYQPQVPL